MGTRTNRKRKDKMVSVIIPVVRPDNLDKLIKLVRDNAGIEHEIITEMDKEGIGCPKMVAKLLKRTKYEYVCFIGDDTEPQKNFLKEAMEIMKRFKDSWGLVGLNDLTGRRLPTHWVASKSLLVHIGGEFFHTGYNHCYCDNELWLRSEVIGRYMYALNAVVKHNHPLLNRKYNQDKFYLKVYNEDMEKDKELFLNRNSNLIKH